MEKGKPGFGYRVKSTRRWAILMLISSPFVFATDVLAQPSNTPNTSEMSLNTKTVTEHFNFYSVANDRHVKMYGQFLEDFLSYIDRNLVSIPSDWPVDVFLLPTKEELWKYSQAKFGERRKLIGSFYYEQNSIYTYTDAGLGTLAHELMHKIVREKFAACDLWAVEGIPSFFEKIYCCRDEGNPRFYFGYENPWRLVELDKKLPALTIRQILDNANNKKQDNESEQRLLASFIFRSGKLKPYIDLSVKDQHHGYSTILESVFNKSISQLEPSFADFVHTIYVNRAQLKTIPQSQYFATTTELSDFFRKNPVLLLPLRSIKTQQHSEK